MNPSCKIFTGTTYREPARRRGALSVRRDSRLAIALSLIPLMLGCPSRQPTPEPFEATSSYFSHVAVTAEGNFAIAGNAVESGDYSDFGDFNYMLLDSAGNVEVTRMFRIGLYGWVHDLELAGNGDILVRGSYSVLTLVFKPVPVPCLYRLTESGELIWFRDGRDEVGDGSIGTMSATKNRMLRATPNETEPVAIERDDALAGADDTIAKDHNSIGLSDEGRIQAEVNQGYIEITRYSPLLEVIWETSIPAPYARHPELVFVARDGAILVCGGGFRYDPIEPWRFIWLARVGMDGSVPWYRTYDLESSTNTVVATEGADDTLYLGMQDLLMGLDSDGNELWRTAIDGDIYDLTETDDDRLVAVGRRLTRVDDRLYSRMLLVKFDQDGNILLDRTYRGGGAPE